MTDEPEYEISASLGIPSYGDTASQRIQAFENLARAADEIADEDTKILCRDMLACIIRLVGGEKETVRKIK